MMKNPLSFLLPFRRKAGIKAAKGIKVPTHIAFIMNGNRRWAEKRGLPRVAGYKFGLEALKDIYQTCADIGVKYLTVYAFSTENMKRPKEEVSHLMDLFLDSLTNEAEELFKKNARLKVLGRTQSLSEATRKKIAELEQASAGNKHFGFQIMFNYGGRAEITDAVKRIAGLYRDNDKLVIDEKLISDNLYTAGIPDPDLLIRTGGDSRVSNFLLWQIAYTEILVTERLFPDFRKDALMEAIGEYSRRNRSFGR